jgi:hypothetical protein
VRTLTPNAYGPADNAVSPVRFLPSTKQGYLWKRSNNIRKDWKRRFFCIKVPPTSTLNPLPHTHTPTHPHTQPMHPPHPCLFLMSSQGGKLSYFRDHDPIGPPRGEICDLMLSTVRECQRPGDPRFSFEILSPGQRVYMLQVRGHRAEGRVGPIG